MCDYNKKTEQKALYELAKALKYFYNLDSMDIHPGDLHTAGVAGEACAEYHPRQWLYRQLPQKEGHEAGQVSQIINPINQPGEKSPIFKFQYGRNNCWL